jgi:Radical SAM superfamily
MNHVLIFSLSGKRWERALWGHRVASFLRTEGWDCEVIDYTSFWKLEELQELVRTRTTDKTVMFCFGTAFLNPWSPYLNDFIAWLKEEYPSIPRVVGGNNALVTKADNIDYWVDSYGENAMLALCRHLIGTLGEPLKTDPAFFGIKKVIRGIYHYPSAPLSSYLIDYEDRDFMSPYECPQIETARGCMFSCSYCNFPLLGQSKDVSVSKEEFKKQLQIGYDKWGIKNWRVMDETFNDRPEKIRKYAEVVDELGYDIWMCGFARGDLVVKHKEHWDDYIRLGFLGHSMGIETFNREAGKLVRKGMDPDKLKEGLLEFQSYTDIHAPRRYRANIQMICGIPGETVESWYDSMNWLNTHWARQSASAWILEVSDYDETLTNQSRFTKELVANGLEKLDAREHPGYEVVKDEKGDVVFKSIRGGGVGSTRNNVVIWKHNTLDWYKAEYLVKEFYDKENGYKGRKGGNPFLSDRLFPLYQTNNYSDVYDVHISEVNTNDDRYKAIVQDYINKKLSWKPNV